MNNNDNTFSYSNFYLFFIYFVHKGRLSTQGQGKKLIETGLFIHLKIYFSRKACLCTQARVKNPYRQVCLIIRDLNR